jgi:hypothetical protein
MEPLPRRVQVNSNGTSPFSADAPRHSHTALRAGGRAAFRCCRGPLHPRRRGEARITRLHPGASPSLTCFQFVAVQALPPPPSPPTSIGKAWPAQVRSVSAQTCRAAPYRPAKAPPGRPCPFRLRRACRARGNLSRNPAGLRISYRRF